MNSATMTLICNALDTSGAIPTAIQVIPAGYHTTSKGNFVCDAESVRLIMSAFASRDTDMVVDYEHQTLKDVQAPAAGWIKAHTGLEDRGVNGLWARVQWNERARGYLQGREYRYVSPVFLVRAGDQRVVHLINVALTNQPNIDGMTPIVNKAESIPMRGGEVKDFSGLSATKQAEVMVQARSLVSRYNTAAMALSGIVKEVYTLLDQYGGPVPAGFITSGFGWEDNALECIPALAITGEPFPVTNNSGAIMNRSDSSNANHFMANRPITPAQPLDLKPKSPGLEEYSVELAKQAQNLVNLAKEQGEYLTISEAVSRLSKKKSGFIPSNPKTVDPVELARRARELVTQAHKQGKTLTIADAVFQISGK